MMAEKRFALKSRVELVDKKLQGTIAYIGNVESHSGTFYGIILDEPKGKNNGSVKGKCYFTCPENHGIFVRQTQIQLIEDDNQKVILSSSDSSEHVESPKEPEKETHFTSSIPVLSKMISSDGDKPSSNTDLQAHVKDLEEKLQTLIIKRTEDKAKLKELEKLKIQNQVSVLVQKSFHLLTLMFFLAFIRV